MCGQVKHAKIFSSIVPDWRLVKLLASLETKNTEGLIGAIAKVLADEGIELADSTLLLKDLLAPEGVLTRRKPRCRRDCAISTTAAASPARSRRSISGKAWRSRSAPAWRWRRWKAPTRCCAAPRRSAEGKPLRLVKASQRRKHLAVRRAGGRPANHRRNAGDGNHGARHRLPDGRC